MRKFADFIATLGTNPDFIVANAHLWFAAFVVLASGGSTLVAVLCVLLAAVKEFWFDAKYEMPHQTTGDDWCDFGEYLVGIIIGYAVAHIV